MPYLFDHLDAISELVKQSPLGLITDVDGTISPIAPSPQEAYVSPLCREQLALLAKRLPLVAAVSGRLVSEVKSMVGIEGMIYIGNHGLELWVDGRAELNEAARDYIDRITQALKELATLLELEGVTFDNKGATASIHYRKAPDRRAAREAILSALTSSPSAGGLQVIEGRMVVDLRPPLDLNKGTAVRSLVDRYHLRGAIYLGDDTTDVDAFEALHLIIKAKSEPFNGIAIGVVDQETLPVVREKADFTLNGVGDVGRFLAWLVKAIDRPVS